jgi:hypothetical protein
MQNDAKGKMQADERKIFVKQIWELATIFIIILFILSYDFS